MRRSTSCRSIGCAAAVVLLSLGAQAGAQARTEELNAACGSRVAYFIACLYGLQPHSLDEMALQIDQAADGTSTLAGLQAGLAKLKIPTEGRRLTAEELFALGRPVILPLQTDEGAHFVVFGGTLKQGNRVAILDPPNSSEYSLAAFSKMWSGVGLVALNSPPPSKEADPEVYPLVCLTPRQDLGQYVQPVINPISVSFTIRNRSSAPVATAPLIASCGCTKATISRSEIAAGEEAEVSCAVRLTGDETGRQHYTVAVPVQSPRAKPLILEFSADYEHTLSIRPSRVHFGRMTRAELPCTRTVEMHSRSDTKLSIIGTESSATFIAVKTLGQAIVITLTGETPTGGFDETVTIRTNHGTVALPVRGERRGAFAIMPNPLVLPTPDATEAEFSILASDRGPLAAGQFTIDYARQKLSITADAPRSGDAKLAYRIDFQNRGDGPGSYEVKVVHQPTGDQSILRVLRPSVSTTAPAHVAP